ncbi:MAG: efflux RND transporter periplasmic adaptor subunit [Acidobacteriales bacterium]|nr:efflux RND transporter periplasmic adaptor subunit [Terriglobales bacterium]
MKIYFSCAAVLVCVVGLAGCKKSAGEEDVKPEVTAQVVKVQAQDLEQHLSADAVLYPRDQAAIVPKVTAPVAKFYVQRGQRVKAGQLLATLQNQDLAAAVTESKGALEQAQAGYENATQATIPEDVRKAQLDVAQTQQNLSAQEAILNSRKTLFAEGAIPKKDLDAAQVAYVQAKAAFDIASQHLQSVQKVSETTAKQTAQGQLTAAKGHYETAAAALQFSEIRSPINGVVTERNFYPGETPPSGSPLITVMDTSMIIAKAHVTQDAARALRVGQSADVTPAGQDKPVEGKVMIVSPSLDPNSTTVEIWVSLPNPHGEIRPGSAARLDIVTNTAKGVLAVPTQSVVQGDKGASVMQVGGDGIAHSAAIETGITDTEKSMVQVKQGLKAGDTIVGSAAYGLPDGAKVKPAEEEKPAAEDKN